MQDCKSGDSPVAKGKKFSLSQCPKNDPEVKEMQKISHASVVGSLMYAQVLHSSGYNIHCWYVGQISE